MGCSEQTGEVDTPLFRVPRLESVVQAATLAAESAGREVDELDLLDALAGQADAVAGRTMAAAGLRNGRVRPEAGTAASRGRTLDVVVRDAEDFAAADGSLFVATEHVLCVLLAAGSASSLLLESCGLDPRLVRSQLATEASEVGRPVETAEIRGRSSGAAVAWRDVQAAPRGSSDLSCSARAAETVSRAEAVLGVAVVTVVGGGEDIAAVGFADAGSRARLSADSRFRIGSLTKVLTAIAALALAERAVVDLDVPVGEFLTSLRLDPAPGPTLRQLLTHVGGAPDGAWLHSPGDVAPSFIEAVGGVVALGSPPGERWEYSNVGYAVVGQVLEDSAGLPFANVVRDTVLAPLGMASTTIAATPVADLPEGYWIDRGVVVSTPKRDIIMRAAGGAISTPSDMARLLAFIATPSATAAAPISEDSVAAMLRAQVAQAGPAAANQGIALRLRESGGRYVGWHPGRISGFPCALYVTAGAGSAVMVNTESLSASPLAASALADATSSLAPNGVI